MSDNKQLLYGCLSLLSNYFVAFTSLDEKRTITACSQAYVPYYFFSSEHPAGRALTSDWSANSFMMVVCEITF